MNNAIFSMFARHFSQWRHHPAFHTQFVICVVFIALIGMLSWSLASYWNQSLRPRLYGVAETQAKILAESQATALVETLERTQRSHLPQALRETVREMLIVEDPGIGERFIRGLSLRIDYDTVEVAPGSLDLVEGNEACETCFQSDVLLAGRTGEILGMASFSMSDGYFRTLAKDMKSRLFAESGLLLVLIIAVWVMMMIIFHRLHAAKRLVEASDQAKARFMANVTHELRTPLNAILGYTQLYKNNSDIMREHGKGIHTIDRSADHLLLMINDILEFSRTNEESLKLHPDEFYLNSFLSTLIEMTRVRAQLKGLDFNYEVEGELPEIIVADEKRLRQILLNLLSNAVKFTNEGGVIFKVERLPFRGEEKCRLQFSVCDTGIGIESSQLKHIFIPFHQLDNPSTRAEGTGLGLTISKRLIELMGSKLQVKSLAGEGSEFFFTLSASARGVRAVPLADNLKDESRFHMPNERWLAQLTEQISRHNILGVRELTKQLQEQPEYSDFLQKIQPFISEYRFKPLLAWLAQQNLEAPSEQGDGSRQAT